MHIILYTHSKVILTQHVNQYDSNCHQVQVFHYTQSQSSVWNSCCEVVLAASLKQLGTQYV